MPQARIAVVEDDAFQRKVAVAYLSEHGMRPVAFASGAAFKLAAATALPDIVLLDLHLGKAEDGFAVARWARALGPHRHHRADLGRRRDRPCRQPGIRGRRLRGQAIRAARAAGADQGPAAPRDRHAAGAASRPGAGGRGHAGHGASRAECPEPDGPAMAAFHAACIHMLRDAYGGGESSDSVPHDDSHSRTTS